LEGDHADVALGLVAFARKLRRYSVNGRQRSLREISKELAAQDHMAASASRSALEPSPA